MVLWCLVPGPSLVLGPRSTRKSRDRLPSRQRCRTVPRRDARRQAGSAGRLAAGVHARHDAQRPRTDRLRRAAVPDDGLAGQARRDASGGQLGRAAVHGRGPRRLEDVRPDQRRLHRQLPAVRHEPVDELTRSAQACRTTIHRPALRAELRFHSGQLNREHPKTVEPTWFGDSVGRWTATRSSSTPSASTATRGSTRSAIRTATRST